MDHHRRQVAAAGRTPTQKQPRSPDLYERQREFAEALLTPDRPTPRGLDVPNCAAPTQRFNVYRNNAIASLVDALASAWPITQRIVGEAFFTAMARIYVSLEPPSSPVLLKYGDTFASFIEGFEPAASVPYLGSVARLERAWVRAYHAPDVEAIDLCALGAIEAEKLVDIRFRLHPSLSVVSSSYPVVDLWRMHVDGDAPGDIEVFSGGQQAVVIRPLMNVEVRAIGTAFACFIQTLLDGATIAEATAEAMHDAPEFKLAEALADLLSMSAIVGFKF
jgi:hypothetical protein